MIIRASLALNKARILIDKITGEETIMGVNMERTTVSTGTKRKQPSTTGDSVATYDHYEDQSYIGIKDQSYIGINDMGHGLAGGALNELIKHIAKPKSSKEEEINNSINEQIAKLASMPLNGGILDEAVPTETQVVDHDKFDTASYDEMSKLSKELAKSIAGGTKLHQPFKEMGKDIFNALYKYNVDTHDPNTLKSTHRLNHELISRAMDTEQYQKLREHTKMDKVNSAMASVIISEHLKTLLKDEFADEMKQAQTMQEVQKRLEQALREGQSHQAVIETLEQNGQQVPADIRQKLQKAINDANRYKQLLQQQQQAQQQATAGKMSNVRSAMRSALTEAEKQVSAIDGFGWGTGSGSIQKLNIEERLEIAKKMKEQDRLRAIAALLGKMKRIAFHAQKNKVHTAKDEIHDITLGGEISLLIPSEAMKLVAPELELAIERDILEKQALQYQLEGKEKQGKGAVVCCIDISGSIGEEEDIWQKAVALALLDIAHTQKRDFACILYSGEVDRIVVIPHNDPQTINKVIEIGETYTGGGTNFMDPLTVALSMITYRGSTGSEFEAQEAEDTGYESLPSTKLKADFSKADIVFITDGQAYVSDEWANQFNELRKNNNVKVHSMLINATDGTVRKFSDSVIHISDLISNHAFDEAHQVFAEI